MITITMVAVALFAGALVAVLMFAASLLALVVFRFAPSLQGSVLALTASDMVRVVRSMPLYPSWWRHSGPDPSKQMPVIFALNPLRGTEYLYGFDPLHHPLFSSKRAEATRFNLGDRFAIERVFQRLD